MRHLFSRRFVRDYHKLPKVVRGKFKKQLGYLLRSLNHPSLRAKKYDEEYGIWQGRIDQKFRFYFLIKNDVYLLLYIEKH